MCEPVAATITRVITKDYAECVLWVNGAPGKRHCIIEDPFGARRGDVVELAPASPREEPLARLAYLAVPVFFAMGCLLGGAGGVEGVICALSLKDGYIPQTIGYQTPDPECDLDYVTEGGREQAINYALSNSLGFGGHNASILFKKFA